MRKIMFSILFLWISTTAFGQSMDWTYLTVFPELPITYVDDRKVSYESPDGEYYGYSEGSIYVDPNDYIPFWSSYDSSPLSGRVILNQEDPETFYLVVEAYTASSIRYYFGFFTTYDPN